MDDITTRALSLRAAQLTASTSHPHSLALLIACPPEQVPWVFAAADAAVKHGSPPGAAISNLLDYLHDHPMPTDPIEWAVLIASL